MEERVAIYIDGGNFYHALKKDFERVNLDFEKFAHKLTGSRRLFRVHYYAALPKQHDDPKSYQAQQKFLDSLDHRPYFDVCVGKLIKQPDGSSKELGLDVRLAVDMLEMAYADAYDTAILVSGDGDMESAVSAVKRRGKHVEAACMAGHLSAHLRKICDRVTIIDAGYLENCWEKSAEKPAA